MLFLLYKKDGKHEFFWKRGRGCLLEQGPLLELIRYMNIHERSSRHSPVASLSSFNLSSLIRDASISVLVWLIERASSVYFFFFAARISEKQMSSNSGLFH